MYQLTCVCGNTLEVADDALGHPVMCAACKQTLVPLQAQPAAPATAATAATAALATTAATAIPVPGATKACPFCGEQIAASARKCRWCGEFLDRASQPMPTASSSPPEAISTETVFSLHTSQWDNFWRYLVCLCAMALGTGGFLVATLKPYKWDIALIVVAASLLAGLIIFVRSRRIEVHISPMRIEKQSGLLSKKIDWVSMPSVVDLELRQGILQRVLGVGTIVIRSNDTATPEMVLYQLPQARKVFHYLQEQVSMINQKRLSRP